ncbi:MAG TPA: hypothetical protein VG146_15350 [Verrucomicrobiae bacterium]|nr:hypothetical protein [Verrucomicrobiae bacterium]
MKNFLIRLSVAAPVVGGVLVILLVLVGTPARNPGPPSSTTAVQTGTNVLTATSVTTIGQPIANYKFNLPLLIIVVVGFILHLDV